MGVGGQRHAPAAFTPGKDPVPIVQETGWAPGPVWIGAENIAPTGIRSPDLPARSESLDYAIPAPPVTCSVTENGRFQEICIVSCLLTDDIHNVNSFTRTAANVRPLDPARYSRLAERILIKLWCGSFLLKFVYSFQVRLK
jgi:hypothetical protein